MSSKQNVKSICEVSLGHDLREKLGPVTFDVKRRLVKIGREELKLIDVRHRVQLREVMSTVMIPARSSEVLDLKVTSMGHPSGDAIFGPAVNVGQKGNALLMPKALVNVKRGKCQKPVINAGNAPLEPSQGVDVGRLDDYTEEMTTPSATPTNRQAERIAGLMFDHPELTPVQRETIMWLISSYSDVVVDSLLHIGGTSAVKHVIDVEPGTTPIRSKPYAVLVGFRSEVKRQINELKAAGIIEPSAPEWASPIVLVKKEVWRMEILCGLQEAQCSDMKGNVSRDQH